MMYVGFLSNFSQGKGDCLEDEPARNNDYAYPDLPPGAMYNAEHQCRLQFGVREASVCSQLHEVNRARRRIAGRIAGTRRDRDVQRLTVSDLLEIMVHRGRHLHHHAASGGPGNALRKTHGTTWISTWSPFLPPVDAMPDARRSRKRFELCSRSVSSQWCQNQECVPIVDRPRHIDGGWGEWGSWSDCSRTCGAGVSIVERKCDHPEPAHGGKFCIGERRRYKICNTQPCPEGAPSFRAVQCSNYDGKEYKGKNYTWLPYFDQSKRNSSVLSAILAECSHPPRPSCDLHDITLGPTTLRGTRECPI